MELTGKKLTVEQAVRLSIEELQRVSKIRPLFNSTHEGYAVIAEEFDELWEEVKKRHSDTLKLQKECIQVIAMGLKFLTSPIYGKEE